MISPFDTRNDAPNLLRAEAARMTLKFDRTGPGTGRISWNIPTPATGCQTDTGAYCGILVTINTSAASTSTAPKHGEVYSDDTTADDNLFAGDTIGSAKVVAYIQHDVDTNFVDIDGLKQGVDYYVSAYPMDCEGRYYREGIHAYSQNYRNSNATDDTTGHQTIVFDDGIEPSDKTGLDEGTLYSFKIQHGLVPKQSTPVREQDCVASAIVHEIVIDGADAQTYTDLVIALNAAFGQLMTDVHGTVPPNTNTLVYTNKQLKKWNGHSYEPVDFRVSPTPLNETSEGTYWFDGTVLRQWEDVAWVELDHVMLAESPEEMCDGKIWFDGTTVYRWTGTTWKKVDATFNETDPTDEGKVDCGAYWYNTKEYTVTKYNSAIKQWETVDVVVSETQPDSNEDGLFWFDTTNLKLFEMQGGEWTLRGEKVRISELKPTTHLTSGTLWYNPKEESLAEWNITTKEWEPIPVSAHPISPTSAVVNGAAWWDVRTDEIKEFDEEKQVWVTVSEFFQQDTDPTAHGVVSDGHFWVRDDHTIFEYDNGCFKEIEFFDTESNPNDYLTEGTLRFDGDNWFIRENQQWVPISVLTLATNPQVIDIGMLWLDSNGVLRSWNGLDWIEVSYSRRDVTPKKGALWFNIMEQQLKEWDGELWINKQHSIEASFNCGNNIRITDMIPGALSLIFIEDIDLLKSLTPKPRLDRPTTGTDGVSDEPSYQEMGVGTDGNNEHRLQLYNEIKYALGYPTVEVELVPEQLDFAIDSALQTLREHSSICYTRGFFFLQIEGETQKYKLTNRVSGMNKIVDVLGVHRLTSAFLSSAHGAGVYGQIVLQHMYNMGTFDLMSYHIMTEYTKNLEILFAARVTYNWNEQTRELFLHQRFPFSERLVLVDAAVERTEQEIIQDRICRPWIRRWATAEAMMMLANTRGKFSTLPGAGGSVSLNATDLRVQATADKEICMQEIADYVVDTPETWGIQSQYTHG